MHQGLQEWREAKQSCNPTQGDYPSLIHMINQVSHALSDYDEGLWGNYKSGRVLLAEFLELNLVYKGNSWKVKGGHSEIGHRTVCEACAMFYQRITPASKSCGLSLCKEV